MSDKGEISLSIKSYEVSEIRYKVVSEKKAVQRNFTVKHNLCMFNVSFSNVVKTWLDNVNDEGAPISAFCEHVKKLDSRYTCEIIKIES